MSSASSFNLEIVKSSFNPKTKLSPDFFHLFCVVISRKKYFVPVISV